MVVLEPQRHIQPCPLGSDKLHMFLPVGGREEGYSTVGEFNEISLLINLKQKCNHFIPRYCAVVVSGASLYSSQSRNRSTAIKTSIRMGITKK